MTTMFDPIRQPVFYKLVGREAVPCGGHAEWADAYAAHGDHHIALTAVGDMTVSTVFLSIDLALPFGPPELFETKILFGPEDFEARCSTYDEAERLHAEAVALAQRWAGTSQ
jgi:hypothetical protein